MSTYAIGDVQGCYDELCSLLDRIGYDPAADSLYFAGDLINRGPRNLETLELIMSLPSVQVVLGNHDLHFLAVARMKKRAAKKDTLEDLIHSEQLDGICSWLCDQPLICYIDDHDTLLVHAGIPHIWTVPEAMGYAAELENTLKNDGTAFFQHMYGNDPVCWQKDLTGWTRLRGIANYLTRLRFVKSDGSINLTHKTEIAPPDHAPWFQFPRPDNARIAFGHWAALNGKTDDHRFIALDTGCVWGRELTAFRLEDEQYFSVPAASSL